VLAIDIDPASLRDALFLVLGWSLGLFGPWLTDLFQRPSRRRKIRKSLEAELRELRYKLSLMAVTLAANGGDVDRGLLEWAERIARVDKPRYNSLPFETGLQAVLQADDLELANIARLSKGKWDSFKLKKLSLPFLASQIPSLSLFRPEYQRLALSIHSLLETYNEEVDAYRFYYEKTFDSSLSNNSRNAVLANLENTSQHVVILCRQIGDRIEQLLIRKK
jgi:hypothetical protein